MASSLIANVGVNTTWAALGLALAPSTAASQITFDTGVAGGTSSAVSSKTVSMTLGTQANYLVVGILGDSTNDLLTSVTYAGVAMTPLMKAYNTNWVYVYGLYAPTVGTAQNIVATMSGSSSKIGIDAVSYTNMSAIQPNNSVSILLTNSKTAWTAFSPLTPGCLGVQVTYNTSGGGIAGVAATGTGVTPAIRVNDSGVLSLADTAGPIPLLQAVTLSQNTKQWVIQRADLKARWEESQ